MDKKNFTPPIFALKMTLTSLLRSILLSILVGVLSIVSADAKTEPKKAEPKKTEKTVPPQQLEKLTRPLTPIEVAASTNNTGMVATLLQQKKNPNPPNTDQGFPLLYAVFYDNVEMATLLLDNKANVNAKLKNGITALYFAVTINLVTMSKLLIDNKADIDQAISGTSLHDMASVHGYWQIADLLEKAGAKVRPVYQKKKTTTGPTVPKKH